MGHLLEAGTLVVSGNFLEYAADSHCSWRRYTVCDDKFVMAASDESSTVIHVDVSLIANDEDELFVAREMHEILSDKIGRDPDDYGPHSADPEALMDGDGEDSDDVSSDGDVVGDAAVPVVNIMGRPKRAAAQKCDTARKAARNLGYRIRSNR